MKKPKRAILFVCTHNSARSFMAEYLARSKYPDIIFRSAGIYPVNPDPGAVAVLKEEGIDTGDHVPKTLGSLSGERFDLVIFLCRSAMNAAYSVPQGKVILADFTIPSGRDRLTGFRELKDELKIFIDEIVETIRS